MKIKIIVFRTKKKDRMIFRLLFLTVALWIFVQSFAPALVKNVVVVVKEPPAVWQTMTKENGEIVITDYVLKISERRRVIITAYSSTRDQTDSTPFITASGIRVRDGIVACNFLEFGTRALIPEEFELKLFTVEDRMAKKNSHKVDIWFPTRRAAKIFGVKKSEIIVLAN